MVNWFNLLCFKNVGYQLKVGQCLTVRPELVEGQMVKPLMVRQAHHERLNHKVSRLKMVAEAFR